MAALSSWLVTCQSVAGRRAATLQSARLCIFSTPGTMRSVLMFLSVMTAAILVQAQVGQCPPYDELNYIVYLADKHNCSMFWRCDAGKKIPGQCPPGQHFSPSNSTCEDPSTAGCTAVPKSCTSRKPQETCRYKCPCSITQNMETCPTKLVFPTELDVYLWVDTSTCTIGPEAIFMGPGQLGRVSTKNAVAQTWLCPKDRPPRLLSRHSHYADCTKVVRCEGAAEEVVDCPSGRVYDPKMDFCDDPGNVFCGDKTTSMGSCPTTKPLSSCPYTCQCSIIVGKCPAQLLFNATINVTDSRTHPSCRTDPSLIALDDRFYGSLEVNTSSAMFNKCPASNNPGVQYVPDLMKCGFLTKCVAGKGRPACCPRISQFDVRTNTCVPYLVTCQDPPKPTAAPRVLPPPCPVWTNCTAGSGARVRHPTDCTLYCECVQGAPYLGACPPGQHFSELTQTCELPAVANCQIRCPKLPMVDGGRWNSQQCTTGDSLEGITCNITCDADHYLMGSANISCTSSGWYGSNGLNLIPSCNTTGQIAGDMKDNINKTMKEISQERQKAAMLFVLDESGSVGSHNFEIVKSFVEAVVTAFPLSQERSAGVITFNSEDMATVDIGLQQTSTCDFTSQLHDIFYEEGHTDLAGALVLARDEIDYSSSGDSKPVTTLVIVITDGKSKTDPASAAQQLKDDGHIVFTIGVADYERAQLEPLSSSNQTTGAKLFFGLPSFQVFEAVAVYLKTTYRVNATLTCP